MIEKRIFYVWGYNEPKSRLADICIENWRMMLPDYEIIEINEKTKEYFDFDYEYENNLWFKTVYDLKMWAYVSDYMRVKALYDNGGIYLDTDVTIYKDFEPLLNQNMFVGNALNNIPEMAIVGAEKKHKILQDMIDFYNGEIWKSPAYIITNVLKNILINKYNITINHKETTQTNDITIYSYDYFCPFHYEGFTHECIKENTFAVHWQNQSWHSKKNLYFLSNKHRIPLGVLLKQLDFIEKVDSQSSKKTVVDSLISVIIPVKNGANYIKEAITGIKKQNMNTEIIVVDDNSDDETAIIAQNMNCSVIKNEKTTGPVIAKNKGLKEAKGQFILFHDHDDVMNENVLSQMHNELLSDKSLSAVMAKVKDFISPDTLENNTAIIKTEPYHGLLTGAVLFRKEVFEKIGLFDENLTAGEIISLTAKMNENDLKTKKLDIISTNRRIHNTNYGKTNKNKEYQDYASILRAKLAKK